jgi:hypothetical protein
MFVVCRCCFTDGVPRRSLIYALVVGSVLNLINQGGMLFGDAQLNVTKLLLTFAVPYISATYGAVSYRLRHYRIRGHGLIVIIGISQTTIAQLGYLMEISPDDRRTAYSGYFNALAAPATLLPLAGAAVAEARSFAVLFAVSFGAAVLQFLTVRRLRPVRMREATP